MIKDFDNYKKGKSANGKTEWSKTEQDGTVSYLDIPDLGVTMPKVKRFFAEAEWYTAAGADNCN